ncbi:MAG: hypothetical protein IT445_09935 [Phycisphaeraceae bacterium]|nr:hypothetical protein [Phycisphaeraceae bacterium]
MFKRLTHLAPVFALITTVGALAQETSTLQGLSLYGISRSDGLLSHYDIDTQTYQKVGYVHRILTDRLTGIDAAAYVPGLSNIFGFWQSDQDGLSYLIYIHCKTAKATIVGRDMGPGLVTGATVVLNNGSEQWLTPIEYQSGLTGLLNINPNNSPDNEFTLVCTDGRIITRDDLHHAKVQPDGVYFEGEATNIRIRSKGVGSQDGLSFSDGTTVTTYNDRTYLLSGKMKVRLYNDHVVGNGKAMGHWWIEFLDGTAMIDGGGETNVTLIPGEWFVVAVQDIDTYGYNSRLITVNHQTGSTQTLMLLNNRYDSLAWCGGKVFFATRGDKLYVLNPDADTEIYLGSADKEQLHAMEFAGWQLVSFDSDVDRLFPMTTNGTLNNQSHDVDMYDLGSIIFVPRDKDPMYIDDHYD